MANKNDTTVSLKSILGDTASESKKFNDLMTDISKTTSDSLKRTFNNESKKFNDLITDISKTTSDSMEGTFNKLSSTWTDTVGDIAESDDVTTITDGLNDLLSVASNVTKILDSVKSINLDGGLFSGSKNVGSLKMYRLKTSVECCEICRQQ